MQSSGLPRLPNNMHPKNLMNPYADYTVEQLYEFLSGYQLTRDIGAQYEYSNLAVGLLGHVLALREHTEYESLIRSRILKPLEMNSTAITLSPELRARLAPGHNNALGVVPNWDLPTLAGAGALRSDANDILTFLAANLGLLQTPLAPAMAAMVTKHRPTGMTGVDVAYGWHMFVRKDDPIVWHNGGTGGYQSFMGYDPKAKVGVVVLSNASTAMGIDDIGHHLLDAKSRLQEPPKPHVEIQIDPKTLDAFVGRYQLAANFVLTVTREGDRLYAQATGQGRFQLYPEAERRFFAKIADIVITFDADSLSLVQGGMTTKAKRLPAEESPAKQIN